ncbi:hypothetical protein ACFX14_006769 [Malus domestica]
MSQHTVDEQALQITHWAQSGGRSGGRSAYHGRGRRRGRSGSDKSTIECYNCHELGHFEWECPKKGKDSRANYAEASEEMLLMAYMDTNEAGRDHIWFLDSGCSNHICGKRDMFLDFDNNFRESVKLGNDSSLTVYGKGNIRIEIKGIIQVIT